jgi:hypothetical protein
LHFSFRLIHSLQNSRPSVPSRRFGIAHFI